jgi:hypothetical protein
MNSFFSALVKTLQYGDLQNTLFILFIKPRGIEYMLEIDKKTFVFRNKEIWFADYPYDIEDVQSVTFRECKKKVDLAGFTCYDFSTLVIDLTQGLDAIWANLSSDCRRQIRRAQKNDIKVNINKNFIEFYEMSKAFRQRKGLDGHIVNPEFMKKYGTLLTAEVEDEVVTGIFFLNDQYNFRGLTSASKRLDVSHEKAIMIGSASRLLWWEGIRYAFEKGMKEVDMGGYYTGPNINDPRQGVNNFKKNFGGQLVTRYDYEKVYSRINKLARSCRGFTSAH